MYRGGFGGLDRNDMLADHWQQQAVTKHIELAERGDALQQYYVGSVREGLRWRLRWEDDWARGCAVYWFAQAAQAGFPPAQFALARDLANGWGVREDRRQAAYWFDLALGNTASTRAVRIRESNRNQIPSKSGGLQEKYA